MAWTTPATPASGTLITTTIWTQQITDNMSALRIAGFALASQAIGDLLQASSTTQFARIAAVAVGSVLVSGGVGTASAWSTSPTISTSVTTPLIYGGTAANGDVTIEGTTSGTKTTSYVILQPTVGNVGIGTTAPAGKFHIDVNSSSMGDSLQDAATEFQSIDNSATNAGAPSFTGINFRSKYTSTYQYGYIQSEAYGTGSGQSRILLGGWNGSTYVTALTVDNATSIVSIAGAAVRSTTAGTNHLNIFNGTAPVGTLANGVSIYSSAGECFIMDAGGTATQQTPHDRKGRWVFNSIDTTTGKRLVIDVERMLRSLDKRFKLHAVHETQES